MPGAEQVEAALGPVVDSRGARGRLVHRLLGLCLGTRQDAVGLLARLRGGVLGLRAGRVPGLVCFGAGRGNGSLGLLLGGGEHVLRLIPGFFSGPVRFLLSVGQLLLDVVVGAGLLGFGLIVGKPQDLGDPLADLLVGRPVAERLLAERLDLLAQLLAVVERTAQTFFQLANLAAATGNELVHLPSAVTA